MSDQWYVARAKQKTGPFTFAELKELARTVGLLPTDMVIQEGTQKWQTANQVEGLFWKNADDGGLIQPPEIRQPTPLPTESPSELPKNKEMASPHIEPPLRPTATEPERVNPLVITDDSPYWDYLPSKQDKPVPAIVSDPSDNMVETVLYVPPEPSPIAPTEPAATPRIEENTEQNEARQLAPPTPVPPLPVPSPSENDPPHGDKVVKPDGRRMRRFKRVAVAFVVSVVLAMIGDFLRPLAPFNFIAFLATLGLATASIVHWVKRGASRHSPFGLTRVVFIILAVVFSSWCGLTLLYGDREKGYLAGNANVFDRLQSALLINIGKRSLTGTWSRIITDANPDLKINLVAKDGKLRWEIPIRNGEQIISFQADYCRAKETLVYGIVTDIKPDRTDDKGMEHFPRKNDTFSFQFTKEDGAISIDYLKGKGFEELSKVAQGRYDRKK